MDIILDHNSGCRLYALAKSSNNVYYVVKKNSQSSVDVTVSENVDYEDTEINNDSEDWLTKMERSRPELPNFWLVIQVEQNILLKTRQIFETPENIHYYRRNTMEVKLYFHCR